MDMWGRGTVLGSRYTLSERIGSGAMGDVWKADDSVLARQVAVKILLPSLLNDDTFARRFRREASVLATISHPGIVDIHDYGESPGESGQQLAYIVMELIDGRALNEILTTAGPAPIGTALDVAAQALEALHAAHLQGIVHRDIKPANLMLRDNGRLTVTDFGIARAMAATTITASHSVLGTALYCAPEQAEGKAVTGASDLYAIGVVCYEMLTGQLPFTGETVLEVVLKHVREPAPDLPDTFPEPVRNFVATALAKDPAHRFADALAMAAAARAAAVGFAIPAPFRPAKEAEAEADAPTVAHARPRHARRRFLVPILVPCIITVGAGSALLIDHAPFQTDANAAVQPPAVTVSSPHVSSTPTSGSPTTSAAITPSTLSPTTPGAAAAPGTQPGGSITIIQGGGGTQGGGTTGGGAAHGGGTTGGGTTGGGTVQGGGGGGTTPVKPNPVNPAPVTSPTPVHSSPPVVTPPQNSPKPAPSSPTSTPPPVQTVPAGCGGDGWGAITNVGDGLKVGLAQDDPAGGVKVVMGGHTEFGWVLSQPDYWNRLNVCNLNDPGLGMPFYGGTGMVLIAGGAGTTSFTISGAKVSGSSYIKDYLGQSCLTDNGRGNQLTMNTCTPGNTSQEWYLP
ncbi:serine/threonine-protein kinase [Kitasatospora sp. McL0602]|uniref:serine/threonine-protein kinase n=1 Tax=Kitasatospora sp. McL0602 TaxID=3439530 RepID=UPI003F8B6F8C